MLCNECGSEMYLDDVDFNFKGNKDNYWCCNNCLTSCIEQIRFAKSFKAIWHSENDDILKDYVIDLTNSRNTHLTNKSRSCTIKNGSDLDMEVGNDV